MKSSASRAVDLLTQHQFVCDCISCKLNFPSCHATGKPTLDVALRRPLAVLDGVPQKESTSLLSVTRDEMRTIAEAAMKYLRQNGHLQPTMESFKIQLLLAQIWYLFMR